VRVPKLVVMASHPNESVTPENESPDRDKRAPDELHVDEYDAAPANSPRSDRSTPPSMDPSPSVVNAMKSLSMPNSALASMQEAMRPTLSAMTALQQAAIPTSALAAMEEAMRPTLSAMTALQQAAIPTSALAAMEEAMRPTLTAMTALQQAAIPTSALAAMQESMRPTLSAMTALQQAAIPTSALAAMEEAMRPTLSAMTALQQAAIPTSALAAMQESMRPTFSSLSVPEGILGRSALRDWSEALDRTLAPSKSPKVRQQRRAAEFFAAFEAEVTSLPELLRALAVMQERNSHLGLVWRGQQDATWAVDSSLTRRLRGDGHELGEEEMVAVERFQMGAADRWGIPRISGELNYLAELQHEGVPTRLVDVSLDPEVAAWFAVQESVKYEDVDGRLVAWGRSAAPKRGHEASPPTVIQTAGGDAFWQFWADQETRRTNEWGTGRAVPSWQPAALNERMRAQRAAFLFDAEPLIGHQLLELFKERLDGDWRAGEIAEATRIVGFPSAHNLRAKPNSAGIVPMFTLRITAEAKREIRPYLEQKGLTEATIYPDRAGLISYLHRMSAR
jgi:hypothetical protein